MINKGYIKIEPVLESVYQDAGYQSIQWDDALSWTGRVLSLLGIPNLYIRKVTNGKDGNLPPIKIENYRGELPDDFVSSIQSREFNYKIPMYYTTSTFDDTYDDLYSEPLIPLLDRESEIKIQDWYEAYQPRDGYKYGAHLTYRLDSSFIVTNFKDGLVEMAYKAFPLDERGMPLIPNDEKVIRAVRDFIIERLAYKRYRLDPNQTNRLFWNDMRQESYFSKASARSHSNTPSMEEMEAIGNMWTRLIPDTKAYESGFTFNNIEEKRRP